MTLVRTLVMSITVILATGGIGRLHIQGFPTSNHYGATGDGLCLSYRMGAKLAHIDTFQYHPSGAVYPEQLVGQLVTEGIRSEGGHLVNARGERFVNELDTRDVVSSSIIRECEEGRGIRTMSGRVGVWLDTPLLDAEHGPGTVEKHFPAMMLQFERFGIDISKDPVLIYPTLHYQNGGVKIDTNSETNVKNLFVAGEASGGLRYTNSTVLRSTPCFSSAATHSLTVRVRDHFSNSSTNWSQFIRRSAYFSKRLSVSHSRWPAAVAMSWKVFSLAVASMT